MEMGDVRHRCAFHVLNRPVGALFDVARRRIGARAGRYGDELQLPAGGKQLHRQIVVQRRRLDDGQTERLHVEKPERALGAKVAVALDVGGDDLADAETR